jgi:U3 small nucleolar RNA-associated protein 13
VTGSADVDQVLQELTWADLVRLLRYVRDWNTRASSAAVAQRVLHAVVKRLRAEDLAHAFENASTGDEGNGLHELVGLIPYTERHLVRMERMGRLVQESYVMNYLLREMDGGSAEDDGEAMDVDPVRHTLLPVGVHI